MCEDEPSRSTMLDNAIEGDEEINRLLAKTDGSVITMQFDGAVGYHLHVARGETDPEFLWKVALLEALDETILEMTYVDADSAGEAADQIERELKGWVDAATAARIAERFRTKLAELIEVQDDRDPAGPDEEVEA